MRRLVTALCAQFLVVGVLNTFLGPFLPYITAHFGLPAEAAGSLFLAQFLSGSTASLVCTYNYRVSMVLGGMLSTVGALLIPFAGWQMLHVAVVLYGTGLGLAMPVTNLLAAEMQPERRASNVTAVNFSWGLGAVICPILFGFLVSIGHWEWQPWIVAAGMLITTLLIWRITPAELFRAHEKRTSAASWLSVTTCASLFLYIGTEVSIGGWTTAFAKELGSAEHSALAVVSTFYAALLAGRAIGATFLDRVAGRGLFLGCLAMAALGIAILLRAHGVYGLIAGSIVAGFGLAPLFPLIVSFATEKAEAANSQLPGWIFALAGVGGAALPYGVAQISRQTHQMRLGFSITLAGIFLLVLSSWRLLRPAAAVRRAE